MEDGLVSHGQFVVNWFVNARIHRYCHQAISHDERRTGMQAMKRHSLNVS